MFKNFIQQIKASLYVVGGIQLNETTNTLSVEEITAIAYNEAEKYSGYGFDFKIVKNGDVEMQEVEQERREKANSLFTQKHFLLKRFDLGKKFIDEAVRSTLEQIYRMSFAETFTVEKNGKDAVYFYIDSFRKAWTLLASNGETCEQLVREIVRHEFRHVLQIKKLRERGGSGYILLMYDVNNRTQYLNRTIEIDAYKNQKLEPNEQDPIDPIIDKVVAQFPYMLRRSA